MKTLTRIASTIVIVVGIGLSAGCAESYFTLAMDSPLPSCLLPLPSGLTRTDVTVRLSYYLSIAGFAEQRAELVLCDGKHRTLAHRVGIVRKESAPDTYPRYEVATFDKCTDVIEHRRPEPWFHINNDPAIRQQLGIKQWSYASAPRCAVGVAGDTAARSYLQRSLRQPARRVVRTRIRTIAQRCTQEGQLEADLRRDVGPPTTEQAVDPRAAGICHGLTEPKVERQLTYEIPSAGLNFRIREWFHLRPTSEITFCVDHTGRILRTAFTDIN